MAEGWADVRAILPQPSPFLMFAKATPPGGNGWASAHPKQAAGDGRLPQYLEKP